jgi:hypothetical protein
MVDKFSTVNREWQKNISSLNEDRASFVALSVDDSFCSGKSKIVCEVFSQDKVQTHQL